MKEAALRVVAEWLDRKAFPAMIKRDARKIKLDEAAEIIAIVGPRRAGKTFFMYQMMQEVMTNDTYSRTDFLFVDFEDYRLAQFLHDRPGETVDALLIAFRQLTGKSPTFLFLDEIHRLPIWTSVVRTLHNQGTYKIVISGSNSELLEQEIASELRGRYRNILILPFSFREVLRFRNISTEAVVEYTAGKGTILGAFDEYLKFGGFPEVVKQDDPEEKQRLLQSYFMTIFYKDILERYNIRTKFLLESMMSYCVNTYSDLFSISAFEKHLKAHSLPGSKRTISNYLKYLKDAFFLIVNDKFSFSPGKRIMNPKKIYLLDTGFSCLAAAFSENRGKTLENAVGIELLRRNEEQFYYKGSRECDFIIKLGTQPVRAIQVCWELTAKNRNREFRGLAEAMNDLEIEKGLILTYDEEGQQEIGKYVMDLIPVWKWLLEGQKPMAS